LRDPLPLLKSHNEIAFPNRNIVCGSGEVYITVLLQPEFKAHLGEITDRFCKTSSDNDSFRERYRK
jgi:hypothetical protein